MKEKFIAFLVDFFDKWISSGWWGVIGLVCFITTSFSIYLPNTLVKEIFADVGSYLSVLLFCAALYSMRGKITLLFIICVTTFYVVSNDDYQLDWMFYIVAFISAFMLIRCLLIGFNRELRSAAWLLIIAIAIVFVFMCCDITIDDVFSIIMPNSTWYLALKHSKVGLLIILVLKVIPAQLFPLIYCLPDFALIYIIGSQSPNREESIKDKGSLFCIIYIITVVALLGTIVFNIVSIS